MDLAPQLYTAKVMHKRLFPKVNHFTYSVYYVALPLPAKKLPSKLLSFYNKDHGSGDGSDIGEWAKNLLKTYGIDELVENIMIITMPRVLGYVFNPVSFFMCFDRNKGLRAVICEVNNTFGEKHNYVCAKTDKSLIEANDWLDGEKMFHVSPFMERSGRYKFRFSISEKQLGIWIDYFDKEDNKQLLTSLTGNFHPLDSASLRRVFWLHPLVTLKAVLLIHWQAAKLCAKGIRYITKPLQLAEKTSATSNLTKR